MEEILLLLLGCYLMALGWFGYRASFWLQGRQISSRERIGRYQISLLWNFGSGLAVAVIAALTPITMEQLGFRPVRLAASGLERLLGIGAAAVWGVLGALFLYQMVAYWRSAAFREEQARALARRREAGGWYDRVVDNLIPRTRREKAWYLVSALAAGIAEELVFRGFALLVLGWVLPAWPGWALALAAGGMFGLAHSYQGPRGAAKTALLGTLFGLLYLGTGSLAGCILLHILLDASSAFLYESERK